MKRGLSVVVIGLVAALAGGCASLGDLPAETRAELWLNEIEGWLGSVEVLVAEYGGSTEPDHVFEQVVFAYKVLRPQILSTIRNLALRHDLTDSQEARLAQADQRLRDIDVFLVQNESGGAVAKARAADVGWWKRLRR